MRWRGANHRRGLFPVWELRDIRTLFASASFLPDNRVVFNVKGNRYRLEVRVAYESGLVVIRRIGTHTEYSQWT